MIDKTSTGTRPGKIVPQRPLQMKDRPGSIGPGREAASHGPRTGSPGTPAPIAPVDGSSDGSPRQQTMRPRPAIAYAFPAAADTGYQDLSFLEKTGVIAGVLRKIDARDPGSRTPETDRGFAIVKEHLFLIIELERIAN